LLAKMKGAPGAPFLPRVGELYRVRTLIYSSTDKAAVRPAVVLCVPPNLMPSSWIQVVTRSTQDVPGVKHPADNSLGLNSNGTFSRVMSIEAKLWQPGDVEPLGVLPEPYWSQVMARFS
jgi:hypothetical protein